MRRTHNSVHGSLTKDIKGWEGKTRVATSLKEDGLPTASKEDGLPTAIDRLLCDEASIL